MKVKIVLEKTDLIDEVHMQTELQTLPTLNNIHFNNGWVHRDKSQFVKFGVLALLLLTGGCKQEPSPIHDSFNNPKNREAVKAESIRLVGNAKNSLGKYIANKGIIKKRPPRFSEVAPANLSIAVYKDELSFKSRDRSKVMQDQITVLMPGDTFLIPDSFFSSNNIAVLDKEKIFPQSEFTSHRQHLRRIRAYIYSSLPAVINISNGARLAMPAETNNDCYNISQQNKKDASTLENFDSSLNEYLYLQKRNLTDQYYVVLDKNNLSTLFKRYFGANRKVVFQYNAQTETTQVSAK